MPDEHTGARNEHNAASGVSITLCGAAGEVTGSAYLVKSPRATVLVDFGMFQGRPNVDEVNRSMGPIEPASIDAVVVTHAHLDHIGRLPLLAKRGYRGPIFATRATVDLAQIMLEDSARLQEQDAERENRHRKPGGIRQELPPVEALYQGEDIERLQPLFRPTRLEERREIAPGISVRFFEAGHILGSASVEMRIETAADVKPVIIVFSGDIGQRGSPILNDPIPPPIGADIVFVESTYGERDHRSREETLKEFHEVLKNAVWEKRRVLIPAFAVGRTQHIMYDIAQAVREQVIPDFPIYLDSPLGAKATAIYSRHHDLYDAEASQLVNSKQLANDMRNVRVLETAAQSKELNESWEPCVVVAGSGMCDGGRIVHHLKHALWRRNVSVVLTSFMARGTLGRRLAEGAEKVYIFGDDVIVRATIHTIGGFSAHAGQTELLKWLASAMNGESKPRVVLTHGEDRQREALAAKIRDRWNIEPLRPRLYDVIEV